MILLIRSEIVCIFILVYLFVYALIYVDGIQNTRFIRMNCLGIGHVVFDLITLCTVNNIDKVPSIINKWAHIFFYWFAILFCYEALLYTVENVLTDKWLKLIRYSCGGIIAVYFLAAPFLEITYLQGNGTIYSFGMCVYAGYAIAMFISLAAFTLLLVHMKKIIHSSMIALLPMFMIMILCMIFQIVVPEFLFTGGGITIVTVGVFFTYENPAGKFREKAYMDIFTGIKNRNLFNEDFQRYQKRYEALGDADNRIGIVICDLNGLKSVNDTYGHSAGDMFIQAAAHILSDELRHSKEIYRVGGDEFAAFYLNVDKAVIEAEISAVYRRFEQEDGNYPFRLSIAIGYAETDEKQDLDATYNKADLLMYQKKKEMKQREAALTMD